VNVKGKKTTPKAEDFIAKYRDNPSAIAKYLSVALSTGDPDHIVKAIGDMIRAQGVSRFSQKTGLERPGLYRSFSGKRKPPFETVLNVLIGLNMQLTVKPGSPRVEIGLNAKAKPKRRVGNGPKI
jgi:probable addiction module antidote protein